MARASAALTVGAAPLPLEAAALPLVLVGDLTLDAEDAAAAAEGDDAAPTEFERK